MVGFSVTASADGITTFADLQAAVNDAADNVETTIELGGNITGMTSYLNIPSGKK